MLSEFRNIALIPKTRKTRFCTIKFKTFYLKNVKAEILEKDGDYHIYNIFINGVDYTSFVRTANRESLLLSIIDNYSNIKENFSNQNTQY